MMKVITQLSEPGEPGPIGALSLKRARHCCARPFLSLAAVPSTRACRRDGSQSIQGHRQGADRRAPSPVASQRLNYQSIFPRSGRAVAHDEERRAFERLGLGRWAKAPPARSSARTFVLPNLGRRSGRTDRQTDRQTDKSDWPRHALSHAPAKRGCGKYGRTRYGLITRAVTGFASCRKMVS